MEKGRDDLGRFQKGRNGPLSPPEEIQNMSDAMHQKKYRYLGRKTGIKFYGLFECLEHGVVFEQLLSSHLQGRTPKNCAQCIFKKLSDKQRETERYWKGNKKKHPRYRNDKQISQISYETFLGRYKFIKRCADYQFGEFECIHGTKFRQSLQMHFKGKHPYACKICSSEVRTYPSRSDDELRELGFKHFEGKVYLLNRMEEKKTFGRFLCREHGISFQQQLSNYIKGVRGCILCRRESSRFQKQVFNQLKKMFSEEDIELEKKYEDCKNIYQLRFDFFIKSKNLLIECDGIQHFTSQQHWGGEEGLKIRIINDQIKNEYTKKNKINFARIGFYEHDKIKEVLEQIEIQLQTGQKVYRIHDNKLPDW